jgi:hypothetical protein
MGNGRLEQRWRNFLLHSKGRKLVRFWFRHFDNPRFSVKPCVVLIPGGVAKRVNYEFMRKCVWNAFYSHSVVGFVARLSFCRKCARLKRHPPVRCHDWLAQGSRLIRFLCRLPFGHGHMLRGAVDTGWLSYRSKSLDAPS